MADVQDTDPLPDYDTLRKAGKLPRSTHEFGRLFWSLQGPLSTSILVMEERRNVDGPREPYFRQTLSGTTWHPISQASLTVPKVSSITVKVDELNIWQEFWEEYHRHSEDRDMETAIFSEEDEEGNDELLECCGDGRPPTAPELVVRASDKPYVTIHDYVSAVHPWLMGLRDNILQALNVMDGPAPLPSDTHLMVNWDAPYDLTMMEAERWLQHQRSGLQFQARLGPSTNPSGMEEA